MKVLFQTYNTFAQNPGSGVCTKVMALFNELRRQGVDVELFDKWKTKVEDFDIIHFFKISLDNYNLMNYCREIGKKIVVSSIIPLVDAHKIFIHHYINKFIPIHTSYEYVEKMLGLCDLIITESSQERIFINKNFKIDNSLLIAIPNGIQNSIINGNPTLIRQELPFSGDFVLQVGRIDSNKNQLRTIRALKGTGIPLVIVGGPDASAMRYFEQCKNEADDNVLFTGWINSTDPRLASIFAAAKTLVLPSINEIYGNVIMEAGISGCTISCSQNVPVSDWGADQYIDTFNPLSVNSIRDSIVKQFNTETPLGQISFFKEKFSWENVTLEHIEQYKLLLK